MTKHEKYILKKLANGQCANCKNMRDNHTALCSACRGKRLAKYVPRGRHCLRDAAGKFIKGPVSTVDRATGSYPVGC